MAILFDGNTPIQGVTAIDDTIIMSGYEYSEDEICIGCWTNGKPIYRKTVQATSPTSADTYTNIYADIDNTIEVINFYGYIDTNANGVIIPINAYRNSTYYSWAIKTVSGIDMVVGNHDDIFINKPVYLIIEYTKTTDAENSFTVDMLYKTQTPFTGAELISDAYNPNSTYVVGDFCIHDNKLYKCNTAIAVAEAWNSAHWTETKIGNEVRKVEDMFTKAEFTLPQVNVIQEVNYPDGVTCATHFIAFAYCEFNHDGVVDKYPIVGGGGTPNETAYIRMDATNLKIKCFSSSFVGKKLVVYFYKE